MIDQPTVLVLGAGASIPFGFPSGRQLLMQICKALENEQGDFFKLVYKSSAAEISEITAFRDSMAASFQPSVDAFLEKRPNLINIGKCAIAAALMPYEQSKKMDRSPEIPNWYEYLFSKMDAISPEDFRHNQLSVITFNYDRSFEFCFFNALKNSYGLSNKDTVGLLKTLPIVHVYGKLGFLPHMSSSPLPFDYVNDNGLTASVIKEVSNEIKIIHEVEESTPEISEANTFLEKSKKICFLGFGFHPTNILRIMRKFRDNQFNNKKVLGTAYGIEDGEKRAIKGIFGDKVVGGITLGVIDEDILLFMRRSKLF